MRFGLATGTKPMFEVRMDEFGRLPVNKQVEPNRKIHEVGVIFIP